MEHQPWMDNGNASQRSSATMASFVTSGLKPPNDLEDMAKKRRFPAIYPLVMTNIAMENGPFIDGLPIKNGDCPWLC